MFEIYNLFLAYGAVVISTMLAMCFPPGTYGRLATRSSMAIRGVDVCGGVIDADFRGEIKVLLHNRTGNIYRGQRGHRIAQIIPTKIEYPMLCEMTEIGQTARNEEGFGSTGQ